MCVGGLGGRGGKIQDSAQHWFSLASTAGQVRKETKQEQVEGSVTPEGDATNVGDGEHIRSCGSRASSACVHSMVWPPLEDEMLTSRMPDSGTRAHMLSVHLFERAPAGAHALTHPHTYTHTHTPAHPVTAHNPERSDHGFRASVKGLCELEGETTL